MVRLFAPISAVLSEVPMASHPRVHSWCSLVASGVIALALWGCADRGDNSSPSTTNDLTGTSTKLVFGEQSATQKATGTVEKYTFDVEANAGVQIDVDEAYVPGESALVDPPKDVTLTGPGEAKVDAQSTTFPGGGQANAGVELKASGLAAGTYTISFVGVVPHSYFVRLRGHNGTGIDAPCDPKKGVRHNAICGESLRCDDTNSICIKPTEVGGFCNTRRGGDDVCASGNVCVFDRETSRGDEGYNGLCK
jgi:hypothetical protein